MGDSKAAASYKILPQNGCQLAKSISLGILAQFGPVQSARESLSPWTVTTHTALERDLVRLSYHLSTV